jgi:hypothetical protein
MSKSKKSKQPVSKKKRPQSNRRNEANSTLLHHPHPDLLPHQGEGVKSGADASINVPAKMQNEPVSFGSLIAVQSPGQEAAHDGKGRAGSASSRLWVCAASTATTRGSGMSPDQ